MAKLSNTTTALKPSQKKKGGESAVQSKKNKRTTTHDGMDATALKAKSELFLTAISTFAGEDTYYEKGTTRIDRVVDLTHKIAAKDPEWLQRFIPWLRGPEVNIRTMSLIIAAEYVASGAPEGRKVINSVCQRADEPAEILAYWMQKYYGWDGETYPLPSPKLPQALRKGLGDACNRLYDQYTLLKYDGSSRGVGMSEVLNLVHPKPASEEKSAIFGFIIDKEYGNEPKLDGLPMVASNLDLRSKTGEEIREHYLNTEVLSSAGVTWEQLGGLLNGPWTAAAWEAIIPTMGYMALLRNLRNFEGAGISKTYQKRVIDILTDPERVAKSRQMPFRFLSAYKNLNSDTYSAALGKALDLSCQNIPEFSGSTLILVDKSGSMDTYLSNGRRVAWHETSSSPRLWEVGALFAMALYLKQNQSNVDLGIFGDSSKIMQIPKGSSVLKGMRILDKNHGVGHGTNIWGSVAKEYNEHDRVVIFTDMQSNIQHGAARGLGSIPFIHAYDVGGYGMGAPFQMGTNGRYQYGGFSDSNFKLMALLEAQSAGWPF